MGRIVTIALGAFKESVRERVLYNLIVFAFLMIGAAILLGSISVGVEQIILVNLGLAAISVFGLLIAIFIGIGLVSKEIDRRTIYNILSKPVTRAEFILGKYAGLLLTLFVNTAIMTAGFYVALAIQKKGLGAARFFPPDRGVLHFAPIGDCRGRGDLLFLHFDVDSFRGFHFLYLRHRQLFE